MSPTHPQPHLEKLLSTLGNDKLPPADKPTIEAAIQVYQKWVADLSSVEPCKSDTTEKLVALLNEYRYYLDVDVIFDSTQDFLYRQKGQLKLDNSVIEEFLPYLIGKCLGDELSSRGLDVGPVTSFSAVYFTSTLSTLAPGGGMSIRQKDQDFAISRPLYLRSSHDPDFRESVDNLTRVAYVVSECKTNLDKTMFQEACATAHDIKSAVPGAKYFLLCEWLDMTPVSTAPTDIDEVLILRKAKRVNSNIRSRYSTCAGRKASRNECVERLRLYPFRPEVFERFIEHISALLGDGDLVEDDVLTLGYF